MCRKKRRSLFFAAPGFALECFANKALRVVTHVVARLVHCSSDKVVGASIKSSSKFVSATSDCVSPSLRECACSVCVRTRSPVRTERPIEAVWCTTTGDPPALPCVMSTLGTRRSSVAFESSLDACPLVSFDACLLFALRFLSAS
jgi:hypothetical protein